VIEPADVNREEVISAVQAEFEAYEAALVAGDQGALDGAFWASASTVRFGLADRQQGIGEVRAWRAAQGPLTGRRLWGTRIVALSDDVAVVTTLFGYPSSALEGRQTQVWARFREGWRVVSAHVSQVRASPSAATGQGPLE
jgi:AtzH-like